MRGRGVPHLLDGGAYDNTGLEALDSDRYHDVFTITLNAGGMFVSGGYGKVPLVRDLVRANALLYRQSTSLRTRWMVDRFEAWGRTPVGETPAPETRRGVLFGLASTIVTPAQGATAEYDAFAARFPEHRTFTKDGVVNDLSFVPTVFDQLEPESRRGARLSGLVADRGGARPASTGIRRPPARCDATEQLTSIWCRRCCAAPDIRPEDCAPD